MTAPELENAIESTSPDAGSDARDATKLRFAYQSMAFSVSIAPRDDGAVLNLTGTLGILPFTGHGMNLRRNTQAVVQTARQLPHLQLAIDRNQAITLNALVESNTPVTRKRVLTDIIRYMVRIKPILDLIGSLQPSNKSNPGQKGPLAAA